MNTNDLSFVADALLALCGNDREQPYYSERYLDTKIRRDRRLECPQAENTLAAVSRGSAPFRLLVDECRDVLAVAKLTNCQLEVLTMRLEGATFEDIGRRRGCTKQGAQRVFVKSLKKLASAFRVYPYRGLSEVYRQETRRGLAPRGSGTLHR
jgi:hypothetical protein